MNIIPFYPFDHPEVTRPDETTVKSFAGELDLDSRQRNKRHKKSLDEVEASFSYRDKVALKKLNIF